MDVHIFIVVIYPYFYVIFFLMAQFLLSNTLLSYQTSKNHSRFINIHIKLSKKRREREIHIYMCVSYRVKNTCTQGRKTFFCVIISNSGNLMFLFLFLIRYTYTHIYIFTCVQKKKDQDT
jgi:hypothetical protein